MRDNERKSMFIPNDIKESDLKPLLIGEDLHLHGKQQQGFFRSGHHYLILQDDHEIHDEIRIFAIDFNQSQLTFQKKTIAIKTPVYEEHILTRYSRFDPFNGQVVHIVLRYSQINNKKKLVFDIYFLNIVDFIKLDKIDKLTINSKEIDLKIVHDMDCFNEGNCKMFRLNGDPETNVLLFKACYSEDTGEEYDDDNPNWIYFPRACLDIVHLKDDKIWFVRRVEFQFKDMPGFLRYAPYVHYTNEGILFYQEVSDDFENNTLLIQEFDDNGSLNFAYTIPYGDTVSCFQSYGNFIYLYAMEKSDNPQFVSLLKLEEGQVRTLEKVDHNLIFAGNLSDNFFYNLKPSFRRFDRQLLPIYAKRRQPIKFSSFTILDANSKQKLVELTDFGLLSVSYSLNWNISEIGVTFFNDDNLSRNSRGKVFFKICRMNKKCCH